MDLGGNAVVQPAGVDIVAHQVGALGWGPRLQGGRGAQINVEGKAGVDAVAGPCSRLCGTHTNPAERVGDELLALRPEIPLLATL